MVAQDMTNPTCIASNMPHVLCELRTNHEYIPFGLESSQIFLGLA